MKEERYHNKKFQAKQYNRLKQRAANWYGSKHKAIIGGEYIIEE